MGWMILRSNKSLKRLEIVFNKTSDEEEQCLCAEVESERWETWSAVNWKYDMRSCTSSLAFLLTPFNICGRIFSVEISFHSLLSFQPYIIRFVNVCLMMYHPFQLVENLYFHQNRKREELVRTLSRKLWWLLNGSNWKLILQQISFYSTGARKSDAVGSMFCVMNYDLLVSQDTVYFFKWNRTVRMGSWIFIVHIDDSPIFRGLLIDMSTVRG